MSTKDYLEKDYYKALGVAKTAKPAEIKTAYRKLARKYHPDSNQGDAKAEERFKEISEAYSVLSDEKRRKEYDEARSLFGGGFRVPTGTRPNTGGFGGFDLNDIFSGAGDAAGGLGDLFGGVFNRGNRNTAQNRPRRGADVETETTLSFGDAIDGTTVALRLTGEGPCPTCRGTGAKAGTVPKVCPVCDGTGQSSRNLGSFGISEPCKECRGRGLVVDDPCPACSGSGRAMSSRTIQTRIPAGVADGQRIKIAGKGAPGERGGAAGDLYVRVHVKPHPVFGRSADNLTVTVPVTFAELTLGAEVKVPAHRGAPVTVRIPPGTANGSKFRVSGKGVRRKDGTIGALIVTVDVTVPQNLNSKARSAIEDLREATAGADPREDLLERAKEQ
jgi:molecular chaperone DnaJ